MDNAISSLETLFFAVADEATEEAMIISRADEDAEVGNPVAGAFGAVEVDTEIRITSASGSQYMNHYK